MTTITELLTQLNLPQSDLDYNQAMQALNALTNDGSQSTTPSLLKELVTRVSADTSGKVTVLYSGYTDAQMVNGELTGSLHSKDIIKGMLTNGDDIRVIGKTPAGQLLSHPDFEQAVADAFHVEISELRNNWTSSANQFLEGTGGLWGDISERFIDHTVGEVRTLTGGADDTRIFSEREVARIQANGDITTVDGVKQTDLASMTKDKAYESIKLASDTGLAELHIAVDANGKPIIINNIAVLDTTEYFHNSPITGSASTSIDSNTTLNRANQILPEGRWSEHLPGMQALSELGGVGHFANKLGVAGTVIVLLGVYSSVQAAETPAEKEQVVNDWVGHATADWIAGSIGSGLLVGGMAALFTLSAPVTIGLAIVGGIAGSIVGSDSVYHYVKDGVDRAFNAVKTWFFGETAIGHDGLSVYDESGNLFALAQNSTERRDPLILDLNGNGIETTGIAATNPILFDHIGNGIKTATGWVKPTDGFLVLDRNSNGTIDNGTELFGDSTPLSTGGNAADGFAALADLDSNSDGIVNAADAQWSQLRVWRDLNQDGISQPNELFTLDSLGIAGFNVEKTANSQVLDNGNQLAA